MTAMRRIAAGLTATALADATLTAPTMAAAAPNAEFEVPPKRPLEGLYTGSAPLSLAIALAATAVTVQLIIDFVPPVRAAIDKLAAQFNLTQLAHTYVNGFLPQR